MNITLDISKEESTRELSIRERVGIQLLLIIFRIIYPARYDHQVKAALAPLYEILENK